MSAGVRWGTRDSRRDEVIRLWKAGGVNVAMLAKRLGMSSGAVRSTLRASGVTTEEFRERNLNFG